MSRIQIHKIYAGDRIGLPDWEITHVDKLIDVRRVQQRGSERFYRSREPEHATSPMYDNVKRFLTGNPDRKKSEHAALSTVFRMIRGPRKQS